MWRPPPPSIAGLLAHYGLADCRARLVAELGCTVWRIAAPDGCELSLRIYAAECEDITPIATETIWLRALAEAGVHVPRLRDALLDGYAATRPLPDSLRAQIEPLIAARMLNTLQWIVDDWPAPNHRSWGPGFLSGLGVALEETFD
jgi:Ser/Thr protein kinase RdoA (MazF antagonist)